MVAVTVENKHDGTTTKGQATEKNIKQKLMNS